MSLEAGKRIAGLLSGSWRSSPPVGDISESSLERLRQEILFSGSGALIWWKLRNSSLKSSPHLSPLHDAFRLYSARAAVHEHHLKILLPYFHRAGIEPILAKGWAIAQLYPQPGLRPYGDFDICVPANRLSEARRLLDDEPATGIDIDFHERFRELDSSYDELLERSVRTTVGNSCVHIPSPEDHLRLLSIHMLYHGAWKPVWLCDIALVMETAGPGFNWSQFMSNEGVGSEWVLVALALAHQILGARLPEAIAAEPERLKFPPWVFSALLQQWGKIGQYMRGPTARNMLQEGRLMEALRSRWPNRLQATIRMGARVNRMPRLPLQLADVIKRAARLRIK